MEFKLLKLSGNSQLNLSRFETSFWFFSSLECVEQHDKEHGETDRRRCGARAKSSARTGRKAIHGGLRVAGERIALAGETAVELFAALALVVAAATKSALERGIEARRHNLLVAGATVVLAGIFSAHANGSQ
jgi:hypothetical protein